MISQRSKLLFFLFLLAGCSGGLSSTVKEVASFDAKYGVNLSDYESGLPYFDTHEREVVLNIEDYPNVIEELRAVGENKDADSADYINFRVSLLEAEQFYKSALRRPFAGFNDVIRCSRKAEINQSVNELFTAINKTEEAITFYQSLGDKAKRIRIDPSWVDFMRASNAELSADGAKTLSIISSYCNSTPSE
jgi:hypothetical protein